MQIDREAPLRFLKAAFLPDDWIAVLLKKHDTGEAIQRVGPLDMALSPRFQSWLRFKNAHGFSVFVSVNALTPGQRSRTRESVRAVRHVFLDADVDADRVLATIDRRPDLPPPSFVIRSSAGRAHILWRVAGMSVRPAEALQKHLARELKHGHGSDLGGATHQASRVSEPQVLAAALVTTDREGAPTSYGINSFPDPPASLGGCHPLPRSVRRTVDDRACPSLRGGHSACTAGSAWRSRDVPPLLPTPRPLWAL